MLMNEQIYDVPLNEIFADSEFNCRGDITPFSVMELAKNIQENGLVQPIVVQPWDKCPKPEQKYRIVAGHRRYMAHRVNQADTVKCLIKEQISDEQAFTINFVENIERKDLNLLQEAKALERYKVWGFSMRDVAKKLQKSLGWVQIRFNLLSLPTQIQDEAAAGFLTTEQIKHLVSLDRDDQFALVRQIKDSKAKGETFKLKKKKRKIADPYKKTARTTTTIEQVQDALYDAVGPCEFTRALAWAAGNINTMEFLRDVKTYAEAHGKTFSIPPELIELHLVPQDMR
jgi:ParB family chromosome partitioning protein